MHPIAMFVYSPNSCSLISDTGLPCHRSGLSAWLALHTEGSRLESSGYHIQEGRLEPEPRLPGGRGWQGRTVLSLLHSSRHQRVVAQPRMKTEAAIPGRHFRGQPG